MKFTDGYWQKQPGMQVEHPRQIQDLASNGRELTIWSLTRRVSFRGAELDSAMVTTTIAAAAPDVLKVRLVHHDGVPSKRPEFPLGTSPGCGTAEVSGEVGEVHAGRLSVRVDKSRGVQMDFLGDGNPLTSSIPLSQGIVATDSGENFIHEQLTLDVGETVYGLGERFGPAARNGQSVDLWNADGGTATEQAYKNVPFYLTSAGYGVFVNHPERVSYEVGSEINSRVQFSVPGQSLEYLVIYGPSPAEVLEKYTALTGRAPQVPAWSYGLWLSTSFTTDYGEDTVESFTQEMEKRGIPLSVLHFDCYWMRPSHWCDFIWDPDQFPDPEGMLRRHRDRGLKISVWINPYIAQRSHLFREGMENGYLLRRPDGSVRQWDHWQSGMGWVDFTNPDAVDWWKAELKRLLRQGVDTFKTDFGERVPTDVVWHDGSDPHRMHNYYSYLYNKAAYEAIAEEKGEEEAVVFARSATTGGQQFPVHWGGDSEPTFASMAESLRGGLSLGLSGFGYWSHDMGGFEGQPDPDVFTRWYAFGMLSSHSRLHGSQSYRVPWIYGEKAVQTAQRFTILKNRLMPYLRTHALDVTSSGLPLMRHMILEFPHELGVRHVDTQYMFGPDLLVAPVFRADGAVDFYLPTEGWTNILDGTRHRRRGWQHETHDHDSLPLLARDGTLLPVSGDGTRPDGDILTDLTLYVISPYEGMITSVRIDDGDGRAAEFTAHVKNQELIVKCDRGDLDWSIAVIGGGIAESHGQANSGHPELAPAQRMPAGPEGVQVTLA